MLFSATTTKKTEDLVKVALKKELIYIRIEGYAICPSKKRFLQEESSYSSPSSRRAGTRRSSSTTSYIDLSVMCIHGKQKQTKRTTTFFQYCNADSGILLCTDVSARY